MPEDHPDPQLLERFMRNEARGEERRWIVRHLLAGCPRCGAITRRLWDLGEDRPEIPAGSGQVRPERERIARRLAEVLDFSPAERRRRIGAEARFHSPGLCELLIAASRQAVSPVLGVERAEAAVEIAERLPAGEPLARSLALRSWCALGYARRLAGNAPEAAEALERARPLLVEEDRLEEAEVEELAACLDADQGRLTEAERRLDRALALYRELDAPHLQGRALVQKGTLRGWLQGEGAVRQGILWLEEGLALLDEKREPALRASSLHRLAHLLFEDGRREEALRTLREARRLYARLDDGPNLARLRHLEGKIGEAAGSPREAEAAFLDARRWLLGEGLGGEAAAALLDLAVLYSREGRTPEILPLAEDLLPILRTPSLRQGVAAALVYFRHLVESGQASVELLSEMARYVSPLPRERRL